MSGHVYSARLWQKEFDKLTHHGFVAGDIAKLANDYNFNHIRNSEASLLPLDESPAPVIYSDYDGPHAITMREGELVRLLRPFGHNDWRWLVVPIDHEKSEYAADIQVSRVRRLSPLEQLALGC